MDFFAALTEQPPELPPPVQPPVQQPPVQQARVLSTVMDHFELLEIITDYPVLFQAIFKYVYNTLQ